MHACRSTLEDPLKSSLEQKDAATSLEHIAKLESGVLAAKLLAPAKAKSVPEGERAAFLAGYRKRLVELLTACCGLETAVLDGDFTRATTGYGEIARLKKSGHDEFRRKGRK